MVGIGKDTFIGPGPSLIDGNRWNMPEFSGYSLLGMHVPGTGCPEDDPNLVNTITATSQPDCGSSFNTCGWQFVHWQAWYNALLAANNNDPVATGTAWGTGFDNCTEVGGITYSAWNGNVEMASGGDANFVAWAKGLSLDKYSQVLDVIFNGDVVDKVENGIEKTAVNVVNSGSNLSSSLANVLKWLPWIGLGIGVLIIGLVALKYFQGSKITPTL